jgi:hypothetical protein
MHNVGNLNAGDTAKDPAIVTQGIHITSGTYVTVDATFGQTSSLYSYLFMWMLPTSGTIGSFADFKINVRAMQILIL